MPAARTNISFARCGGVPTPGEPKVNVLGFAFARVTKSAIDLEGVSRCTVSSSGP